MNEIRKQSIIAGRCVAHVEKMLKDRGLERVMITINGQDYIIVEELKKAIKLMNKVGKQMENMENGQ